MTDSTAAPSGSSAEQPDVMHIARLARLSLDPAKSREVGAQFARILASFQSLAMLDVQSVEPMTRPTDTTDVLREDRERPSLTLEAALANAPVRIDDFYSVPKTIGGDL